MNNKNWKNTLLDSDSTIEEAVINLNKSGLQIVLVLSKNKSLIGTITDGNIRKGMLEGLNFKDSINKIFHKEPLVATRQMNREEIIQLMQSNGVNSLPLVDENLNVLDLYLISDFVTRPKHLNLMLIMSGGKGQRLLPFTENCPKPLLEVNGKPMLEHIIERAKLNGFYRFVISIYYLGHMIEDYFGNGANWNVEITYLKESNPLGTAGCISLLENQPKDPIVVTNGDILTDINYDDLLDFHIQQVNAVATMAIRTHEWRHSYGVVHTKDLEITGFEEKPVSRTNINAGVYVLSPSALSFLKYNEHCDMPTLFERLSENNLRTIAYPIYESWIDVGRNKDYNNVNNIEK